MLDEQAEQAKMIDLDSLDEFRQLSSDLQTQIKDKLTQHARAKELDSLAQQKRAEMFTRRRIKRGLPMVDRVDPTGPFIIFRGGGANGGSAGGDSLQSGLGFNMEETENAFGLAINRLNGLVPGAPAHTPTQYLSSSSLSLADNPTPARHPPLSRLDELVALADPLIVLDGHLLENSFNQLREIIGAADENANASSDEQLVKLLIRHDCDLNRVVPIVLNLE